jgi:hypothetical protein
MMISPLRPLLFSMGLLSLGGLAAQSRNLFSVHKSAIAFTSDAPLERIIAANNSATGVLDLAERSFAVRIPMRAFEGFNSPLQREHFEENYVESRTFPNALFEGRIIETCDLGAESTYRVRAKGRFMLHGVAHDRIITCTIVVAKEGIRVTSAFDVSLADHDIRVPRVVQQKLAAVVQVKVDLLFEPPAKK